ncbi:MAG: MliC family protein, partial [Nonlabens ulvanivorans]|uniref:MliC family protein n=1 Tax=Nonlabens ulvanivorans TaxID=906888 RepID=UPI003265B113
MKTYVISLLSCAVISSCSSHLTYKSNEPITSSDNTTSLVQHYVCNSGNKITSTYFSNNSAHILYMNNTYIMYSVISASGAKYQDINYV